MAQKTTENNQNVLEFIHTFATTEQKKKDSITLVEMMQSVSGYEARMWGTSIIGFGNYHYKYQSGHEGNAPLIGFSPRKSAISLYVFTGLEEHEPLLTKLGKFKKGKACLYINTITDIDGNQLQILMQATIAFLNKKYPTSNS